ncbi:MAG: hypothetical protein NT154_12555, partial [Verrucomicrobia bacterium]|nr:hypothetical protein [Verrucomicrobiota bacterium]
MLKHYKLRRILAFCLLVTANARAAVLYVDVNSASPTPPYTNWSTAAATIQDAVDAAVAGDEIVVTNGAYAFGGRAVQGGTTNRLAVTKPLTVRSVGGSAFTSIIGYRVPDTTNGPAAVRCLYLTNGAMLAGFTLTNGATQDYEFGGGVLCEGAGAVLTNCVVSGNSASYAGGGV